MAISTTENRVEYQGDGTSAVFSFGYEFHKTTDLGVFVFNSSATSPALITPQTLNSDYTLDATANNAGIYPSGGNVVFNSTPNAQSVVVIFRSSIITNTFVLNQNQAIPSSGLNNQLNYLTLINQRLNDLAMRSVRLPDGFAGVFDLVLPATLKANKSTAIVINSTATGFEIGPSVEEISNAEEYANQAASSATQAATSKTLAEEWATKVTGLVESTDYAAKAWAIGGTGVTDGAGAAKEWATKTSDTVDGSLYSAQEWATGTQTRGAASGGSAKDWANYTGGTVDDTEYSSKYYANAAAASATQAQNAAASVIWNDVVFLTNADSPYTITNSSRGKLLAVDCTSGPVTLTLPQISGLDLSTAFVVGVKKTDSSGNSITINRSGTDTIDGATSKTISVSDSGTTLIPDTDATPDEWTSADFGSSAGNLSIDRFNGDGSSAVFTLSTDPGTENNTFVYVSGVYQQKNTYSVSGTTLTFDTAPPSGTSIVEVVTGTLLSIGTPSDGTVTTAKLANGAVTSEKTSFSTPVVTVINSGIGSHTLTSGTKYFRVRLIGGGGSGGTQAADGNSGSPTYFGSSVLTPAMIGGGGTGAGSGGSASSGGTATGGDINIDGGGGQAGADTTSSQGGQGGSGVFGGGGAGAKYQGTGLSGATNSGAGGGGGGGAGLSTRAGGAAGGYCEKIIAPSGSSYPYVVGDGGAAPSGAGAGAAGKIIIEEFFV